MFWQVLGRSRDKAGRTSIEYRGPVSKPLSLRNRYRSRDDFRQSLTTAKPPAELRFALAGLWWDAKGDWTRAHESAQQDEGPEGSWVHAYLHRKEGDQDNAAYWYGRAGKPVLPRTARPGVTHHPPRKNGVASHGGVRLL